MNVQGVNDKIVVEILKEEKITSGGIVVPEIAKKEPQLTCRVLSVGKDVSEEIKVENLIFCHERSGMDIMVDGKIMKILKDEEVYAVIKD